MVFGRIRDLREDQDLTQQYLADYLMINRRTYSYYELGERVIPPEILIQLSDFYDVSVDYLLGRTDNPAINR